MPSERRFEHSVSDSEVPLHISECDAQPSTVVSGRRKYIVILTVSGSPCNLKGVVNDRSILNHGSFTALKEYQGAIERNTSDICCPGTTSCGIG